MKQANRFRWWTFIILIALVYLVIQFGIGLYTDYLWFQHLGFEAVFLTRWWSQVGVGLGIAVPVALFFWVNALIARWQSVRNVLFFSEEIPVAQKFVVWLIWGAGLLLAWLVSVVAAENWLLVLRFWHQQSFNLADPIFNRDVGFYLFSLPFYHLIQSWLIVALLLAAIGAIAIYALAQQNNLAEGRIIVLPHVQLHLSILGALLFLAFAWGHWLDLFDLMYSPRGVAFGASYTDVHVSIPALWTMGALATATALILLVNIFVRRLMISLSAIFIWIVAGLIGTTLVPGFVQRYMVEPNELASETPYIQNNIRFTNIAYGLDKIQERDFTEIEPLTRQTLVGSETTLKNIRLWDYRPLQQTYQQIQAIRLYYRFLDVDLDRYVVDNEIRQVALAARELDKSQLPATWVTQKLQFTHGYGVVMNPVNEVSGDGLPRLWIRNLPPESSIDLTVERPEIYYGEAPDDYVFVNTREREFNYPSGDENVYANYEGIGGVLLDSYLKRLAFSLRLADINMLLSKDFTDRSRVILYRNIADRVRQLVPFLSYDSDPYLIIGADGRLYWLQDAYTTSTRFPYAEPNLGSILNRVNYIRNSVKVVIDAYDGSLIFYVVDPEDPLLKSYIEIFPELFTPMNQMPDWLRAHLRYPEDLFRIQANLYQTYHMRDVNVFYNKEDLWQVPLETFAGEAQPVEPYYVVLRLPGGTQDEFVLIQPFTPNNKDNLIAWLAARADGETYGQLVTYRFPKQELVFGPFQIEARIDQDPEISAQITLWGQGGSEVIRGNLLVLPIDNSLLYIEPLYLRAENGQIPELRRVILVSGEQVLMRETLAEGLVDLLGGDESVAALTGAAPIDRPEENVIATPETPTVESPPDEQPVAQSEEVRQLAITASSHYEAAQKALQNGDWGTYGAELEKMKTALDALVRLTNQE